MFHSSVQTFTTASALAATFDGRPAGDRRAARRGLTKRELRHLRRLSCLCAMLEVIDTRGPTRQLAAATN
jgi:hypothetical protein